MKKSVFLLIALAILVLGVLAFFVISSKFILSPEGKACIVSGGTVTTTLCCGSVDSFPNTCTIGSCGCSPAASHQVKSCSCGEGKCFNGTTCVVQG